MKVYIGYNNIETLIFENTATVGPITIKFT